MLYREFSQSWEGMFTYSNLCYTGEFRIAWCFFWFPMAALWTNALKGAFCISAMPVVPIPILIRALIVLSAVKRRWNTQLMIFCCLSHTLAAAVAVNVGVALVQLVSAWPKSGSIRKILRLEQIKQSLLT